MLRVIAYKKRVHLIIHSFILKLPNRSQVESKAILYQSAEFLGNMLKTSIHTLYKLCYALTLKTLN